MNHLPDILLRQASTDLILTEVQKAILYLREAVLKDRALLRVLQVLPILLAAAADLHHHTAADHLVLTLQDLPLHQVLHQAVALHQVAEVLLQEGDSQKR